jgi:crotonobetainyl-CoA:carnitine CoA-transferase CaiB-like acyl-CoA transferase
LIGQNTKEVLKDAGYSEEEIQEMLSNQIIFEKK